MPVVKTTLAMKDLVNSRKDFFTGQLSFHSNNDLRTISVYGSPMHMRKKRNVYTRFDKFWMLKESQIKEENPSAVSKISELQQQVNVFQPLLKRTKHTSGHKQPLSFNTAEKIRERHSEDFSNSESNNFFSMKNMKSANSWVKLYIGTSGSRSKPIMQPSH